MVPPTPTLSPRPIAPDNAGINNVNIERFLKVLEKQKNFMRTKSLGRDELRRLEEEVSTLLYLINTAQPKERR